MQRRKLDRDARIGLDAALVAGPGDRGDGIGIGPVIARGIRAGHRRLAQHVIAIGEALLFAGPGAVQRGVDGLAQHELAAHFLHRAPHGRADHRLAQTADHLAQRAGLVVIQNLARQHQGPGRGIDHAGGRLAQMPAPVRGGDLVLDQRVDGLAVGHAQHRFGQTHQRHAFAGGQPVFGQKMLHHRRAGLGADAAHQIGGAGGNRLALALIQPGLRHQILQQTRLIGKFRGRGKHGGADSAIGKGHGDLLIRFGRHTEL